MNAFEKLAEKAPEMHLICIGAKDTEEPEWWRYLMDKTNRSKYKKRIHWMGQVDDVRPWYRAAEMLVLSSESEPFGRVIVEAMAMGVPVIASRGGGVTEIITDNENGILTGPGNDNEIASSIKKVLENETFKNRISSGAKKRAKEFDLKIHVEKMTKIFNEIITNNK
jgi:glycosyltransferase involved in cell wall biosynthesis